MDMLDDRDRVSVVMFNHEVPRKLPKLVEVGPGRAALKKTIEDSFADGGTSLYDAIAATHGALRGAAAKNPKKLFALVVLTDGKDEHSKTGLSQLLAQIQPPAEQGTSVRLFTIAYGSGTDYSILQQIAETAGGAFFAGKEETIRQVYRDLAAFF
jgi:Ca-activated chloride channel family protein